VQYAPRLNPPKITEIRSQLAEIYMYWKMSAQPCYRQCCKMIQNAQKNPDPYQNLVTWSLGVAYTLFVCTCGVIDPLYTPDTTVEIGSTSATVE